MANFVSLGFEVDQTPFPLCKGRVAIFPSTPLLGKCYGHSFLCVPFLLWNFFFCLKKLFCTLSWYNCDWVNIRGFWWWWWWRVVWEMMIWQTEQFFYFCFFSVFVLFWFEKIVYWVDEWQWFRMFWLFGNCWGRGVRWKLYGKYFSFFLKSLEVVWETVEKWIVSIY